MNSAPMEAVRYPAEATRTPAARQKRTRMLDHTAGSRIKTLPANPRKGGKPMRERKASQTEAEDQGVKVGVEKIPESPKDSKERRAARLTRK